MSDFTHNELIIVAERWLKRSFHAGVHVSETTSTSSESPDVIGWKGYGGKSCLVEVKISRGDFFGDMEKKHRLGADGMGNWRYYMVPKNLVTAEEVPDGWGLLYYDGAKIYKKKDAKYRKLTNNAIKHEKSMLYSELRKFHLLLDGEKLNLSRSGRRVTAIYEIYKLDLSDIEFINETGNDDEIDTDYHSTALN